MTVKTCSRCSQTLPVDEFYLVRRGASARQSVCKPCTLVRKAETRARRREAGVRAAESTCLDCSETKASSEFAVDWGQPNGCRLYCNACMAPRFRKQKYGLEVGAYEAAVERQGGICPVCMNERPLVVDHDHATSRVRGFICDPCNVGLGRFGDDPDALRRAIDYLLVRQDVLGGVN